MLEAHGQRLTRARPGGLGSNDGESLFSDGLLEVRARRDRGDLMIDMSRSGLNEWHPAWLVTLHLDQRLTASSFAVSDDDESYRIALDNNWDAISGLFADRNALAAYCEFERNWTPP